MEKLLSSHSGFNTASTKNAPAAGGLENHEQTRNADPSPKPGRDTPGEDGNAEECYAAQCTDESAARSDVWIQEAHFFCLDAGLRKLARTEQRWSRSLICNAAILIKALS